MKKILYFLLLSTFAFTACSDDTTADEQPQLPERVTLQVDSEDGLFLTDESGDKASIRFKTSGGEVVVNVTTNQEQWTYTNSNAGWLTATADNHFLTLKADRNIGDSSPQSTVVITAGSGDAQKSYTLEVSQNNYGDPELTLGSSAVRMPAVGVLQQEVSLETNQDEWSVESSCPWLLVEKTDDALILTVDPNEETAARRTEVRVTAGYGDQSTTERIVIDQDGKAYIKPDTYVASAGETGAEKTIAITANPELEWTYDYSSDWFTVSRNENVLTVTIKPAADGLERRGTIGLSVGYDANVATTALNVIQIGTDTRSFMAEYDMTAGEILSPGMYGSLQGTTLYAAGIDVTVDWGDGTPEEKYVDELPSHAYAEDGLYTVSVTGTAPYFAFRANDICTKSLKHIIAWGNLGTVHAQKMCYSCTALETIPDDTAGAFAEVTTFEGAFFNCKSLKAIPAGLFRYADKVTSFNTTFQYCRSVEAIPSGLFANCPAATNFGYTFYGLGVGSTISDGVTVAEGHIIDIPENLFSGCTAVKAFNGTFREMNIGKMSGQTFAGCPQVTSFNSAFMGANFNETPSVEFFAACPNVTDFYNLFRKATGIGNIPEGMFRNNTLCTNAAGMFQSSDIEVAKAGLLEGLASNCTIASMFSGCKELTTVESGIFDQFTAITSLASLFGPASPDGLDCKTVKLKSVPADLFAKLVNVTSFANAFQATGLEEIPADLFAAQTKCTSYSACFRDCASLKTISEEFRFYGTTGAVNVQNAFYGCTSLTAVPENIFANLTGITTGFNNTFQNCTALQSIPAGLFARNTKVTGFSNTFNGCTALKEIPESLFANCTATGLKTLSSTFNGCKGLTSLPENLFANNTYITTFSMTFQDCTGLTTLPAGLFAKNTAVTSVMSCFKGCSSLTTLPAELFARNVKITNFSNTFAGCTALEALPEGLFAANTAATNFQATFNGCASLKTVPVSLFDNNRKATSFLQTFYGCALTGESPYTVISDGTKVHLYQRIDFSTTATAAADRFSKPTSSTSCFGGCTGLSDYESIPSTWK